MPSLINTSLLNPRDILVIGLIAVLFHVMLAPVFKAVGTRQDAAA